VEEGPREAWLGRRVEHVDVDFTDAAEPEGTEPAVDDGQVAIEAPPDSARARLGIRLPNSSSFAAMEPGGGDDESGGPSGGGFDTPDDPGGQSEATI
jgi:hypothetical protein